MQHAIFTDKLSKSYGTKRGIVALDLHIEPGEVFGYLGPNGAGKTTTIRTLMGLIKPSGGRATVVGLDPWKDAPAIHRRVGYLPGEWALYEAMTGADVLHYFGNLRGGVPWQQVQTLADRLELDLKQPIRTLSKGNKQKIGWCRRLCTGPNC